ncbi:zinc-finger domain-containing protein [Alphaproteobacteria bacterium]|nr:zinc-finger domain-containing protein [Alphaproteobacteria bacterium]
MIENKNFIKVSCDGTNPKGGLKKNEDNSKHPLIYLKVPLNSKVYCPYCGKEFINENM